MKAMLNILAVLIRRFIAYGGLLAICAAVIVAVHHSRYPNGAYDEWRVLLATFAGGFTALTWIAYGIPRIVNSDSR